MAIHDEVRQECLADKVGATAMMRGAMPARQPPTSFASIDIP